MKSPDQFVKFGNFETNSIERDGNKLNKLLSTISEYIEDDINVRQPQWKKTAMEENPNGRQPQWKRTSMKIAGNQLNN